ncbi:MAG: tyrosine-type recombinase/integrase [Acidaminococcaceae bacterium]|nr:tyrosine-type recombinase/integrase [Acidaminococcaceae bacterium]
MGKVKDAQLFMLIRNFLEIYLPTYRHAGENTVKSYRTGLNQYLDYVSSKKQISRFAVTGAMFSYDMVTEYLHWLSVDRKVSSATCNNRLAVIRAFISYASACKPEYIDLKSRLSQIKGKKNDQFGKVDYMSEAAVKALMEAPDVSTTAGLTDQFMMVMLYDTGARIQEILSLRLCDLKIDKTPTAIIHGKGGKTRIVPLMPETVKHLKKYLSVLHPDEHMHSESYLFFTRHKGQKVQMCDDTARYRIQRYAAVAKENCPDVPDNPHPHMWRHTRAMHLYQHGMDLERISQWLGHSQLETTLIYAHSDTEDKRKAIAAALGDGVTGQLNNAPYTVDDEEILRKLYGL